MSFTPTIVSDTTSAPTLDLRLRPGAVLPAGRLQTGLIASVDVLEGSAALAIEGYDLDAEAGQNVVVEPTDDPAIWNTGDTVTHLRLALRVPATLTDDELSRALMAIETLACFGSVRDVTGRAGDGPMREALERELGGLADLVRSAPIPAERFLTAA